MTESSLHKKVQKATYDSKQTDLTTHTSPESQVWNSQIIQYAIPPPSGRLIIHNT